VSGGPFSRRGARWLALVAALSLAVSGLLAAFGDAFTDLPSFGADSYSRSAIGHHAFFALLRELGFQVVASRHRTETRAAPETVVVAAEPELGASADRARSLERIARSSRRLLVVLPKRLGAPSDVRPRWLGWSELGPIAAPDAVLGKIGVEGEVVRPRAAGRWRGELPAPDLDAPQLVVSDDLDPLVETEEGMLAGERVENGRHLVVLADPDVLATHGLGRGANAELAVRLVERLGGDGATVLVDETLHGWEASPSLARELLRWPLVLATMQAALALALLAWAALVRFGRARRPEAALAPGKAFLVANTAALLRHGGHVAPAIGAYWRAAKEQIAQALRTPGAPGEALDAWLARTAAARGKTRRLQALEARIAALAGRRRAHDEAVRAALDVHRFREEMIDGSRRDS
jgi:hypothetical protein